MMEQDQQKHGKLMKLPTQPKKLTPEEKPKWRGWLNFIKEKWLLGNTFVDAKVKKEEAQARREDAATIREKAQAFKEMTEGILNIERAKEIARKADSEQETIDLTQVYDLDGTIVSLTKEIQDDALELGALHGTQLSYEVVEPTEDSTEDKVPFEGASVEDPSVSKETSEYFMQRREGDIEVRHKHRGKPRLRIPHHPGSPPSHKDTPPPKKSTS